MAKTSFFSSTGTNPTHVSTIQSSLASIATSVAATEAALDSFTDIYLGSKASAPTTDNDGDPLQLGMLYFDTTTNELKVYKNVGWRTLVAEGSLQVANNLSDLQNNTQARKNLLLESNDSSFVIKAENNTGDAIKVDGAISGTSYKRGSTEILTSAGQLTNVTLDAGNF